MAHQNCIRLDEEIIPKFFSGKHETNEFKQISGMRTLQSTSISFGIANFPVRLSTLVRAGSTALHNACPKCEGDIGLKNYCKDCGAEVSNAEMKKAYKISKTQKVVFTKEQLETLKNQDRAINIVGSVPASSIDKTCITGSYYVLPDKIKGNLWGVLYQSMQQKNLALAVTYSLRGRVKPGVIIAENGKMFLLQMAYAENIVQCDEVLDFNVKETDLNMGIDFLENTIPMANMQEIKDEYSELLEQFVSGKLPTEIITKEAENEMGFFAQAPTVK